MAAIAATMLIGCGNKDEDTSNAPAAPKITGNAPKMAGTGGASGAGIVPGGMQPAPAGKAPPLQNGTAIKGGN